MWIFDELPDGKQQWIFHTKITNELCMCCFFSRLSTHVCDRLLSFIYNFRYMNVMCVYVVCTLYSLEGVPPHHSYNTKQLKLMMFGLKWIFNVEIINGRKRPNVRVNLVVCSRQHPHLCFWFSMPDAKSALRLKHIRINRKPCNLTKQMT